MKIRNQMNKQYTTISLYVIFTFIVIFAITKVGDNAPRILGTVTKTLHYISVLLTPLIAGFVIAYLVLPIVQFMERRLGSLKLFRKKGKGTRGPAVALTALLVALVLILGLSLIISAVTREFKVISFDDITGLVNSLSASLNDLYAQLESWLAEMNISSEALNDYAEQLSTWLGKFASGIGTNLSASIGNISGLFTNLIFSVIFAIYFLTDSVGLSKYWDRVFKAFSGKRLYKGFHQFLNDADYVFSGYIRGQLMDATIMALLVSIALSLIGVKFSVVIGVLTGIGNLIPYVGPVIAYACTVLACLMNWDIKRLVISVVVLFIIQTVDGNIINPRLLSTSISVHPMLVIVALIIGGAVGGFLGMLLAVPVAALAKIWFDRGVERLSERRARIESAENAENSRIDTAE